MYFWPFHADVKKSARKGPINDSVEQLLSYPFPEIGEITMQMIGKALEGSQKLTFCIFEKVVKYLHICCGILMIWKRDFRNCMIFTQNVTIYALDGNVSWNLWKSAEFDPQNHQYSLGNIDGFELFRFPWKHCGTSSFYCAKIDVFGQICENVARGSIRISILKHKM